MLVHNPPHPGEVLGDLCLEPLGFSVTDAAKALGVSRKTLSSILNDRAGIRPEMSVRLSTAFPPTANASRRGGAVRRAEQRRGALKVAPLTLG